MVTNRASTNETDRSAAPSGIDQQYQQSHDHSDCSTGQEFLAQPTGFFSYPFLSRPICHHRYRADPIAIACIFGLKSVEEIENAFPGRLYKTLINRFTEEDTAG